MKSALVLSLASSTLAVPFGSLLDAIFVKREAPARRHNVPEPEMMDSYTSWNNRYNKGDLPHYPTVHSRSRKSTGTGTSYMRSATGAYPTASGGADFSYQPYPPGPIQHSLTLSLNYGLPPTSTPVEVPEVPETPVPTPTPTPDVSIPLANPEVPVVTLPLVSTPPAIPDVPVVTPPSPPAAPTPSANPGIPLPGSPGNPTPGQPGVPICGQPGLESCGTGAPVPYPSTLPSLPDPWSSYAGPDITPGIPGPTGYPSGTGYPTGGYSGTGVYGPPSTMTTWTRTATPTPMEQPDNYGDENEGYGYEKRGYWKRLEDKVKEALGYGEGKSEMSP